jgi:hypothetical protein
MEAGMTSGIRRTFKVLRDHWVQQIPEETKEAGFWEDFPLIGIPVLWARLSPRVICADLIEERLYRVVKAEETGTQLPRVDGMPADVAVALELARFLQAAEPAQRPARFDEVNDGRCYDYCSWLSELVESRGPDFPDAAIQIADAMSDCCERQRFQADLAMALAIAGRRHEAIARTRASIERFSGDIWVRILAGDVFEELGDDAEAIQQWCEGLRLARGHDDWSAAADRLEETFECLGRSAEFEKILSEHPDPDPAPEDEPEPVSDSFSCTSPPSLLAITSGLGSDVAVPDFGPPPRLTRAPKIGRNDPCPCGSGKKYKKCCLR